MTHVSNTNRFFEEKVYPKLQDFALWPVGWVVQGKKAGGYRMPDGSLLLAALLAPILIPATIVTAVIALCLAAIAALCHGISFIVAGITDACSNTDNPVMAPE